MAIVAERHGTIQQAERLASLILTPDAVVEVRAFTPEGYVNRGYFDNVADMLKAVEAIDRTGRYAGIYWTINPVNPALLARAANRIDTSRGSKASTKDKHIIRRRWIGVDFDPDIPSGISATDEEHEAALSRARDAREWLDMHGVATAFLDSGNGAWLLFPVDLPNDAESTHLVSDILKVFDQQFGGNGIKIDQTVSNAARIARIPGTMNRKGDDTEDRPHRRARIIDIPDDLTPVPLETLEWIRGQLKPDEDDAKSRVPASATPSGGQFDVEGFIQQAGLDVNKKEPYQGGTKWELNVCPFNPEHTDRSAFIIQFANGAVAAGCHHDGCHGKDWKDLRSMFDRTYALRQEMRQSAAQDFADAGNKAGGGEPFIVSAPGDPYPNAKRFVQKRYTVNVGGRVINTLVYYRSNFYAWNGASYVIVEPAALRKQVYNMFADAQYWDHDDKLQDFKPNKTKVDNIIDALKAEVFLSGDIDGPAWIEPGSHECPPAHDIIPFANGLLEISSRRLHPPTPAYFCTYHLPYEYEDGLPEPKTLLKVLRDQWPDDRESEETLQEVWGYILTSDTSVHKIFTIIGPTRSGKGLIADAMQASVGRENYATPTLAGLATNFGMQPLIGKTLAIIRDARFSRQPNEQLTVERLLNISGGDTVTIDRKYMEPWTGQLPTRIILTSNELPRLNEASGALAGRMLVFRFTKSFLGQEDPTLRDKLLEEVPSIISWALDGLDRLRARGKRFRQPASSADLVELFSEATSPVGTFVKECCDVGPGVVVPTALLYHAWAAWCRSKGQATTDEGTFGTDLRAAVSTVERKRLRTGPRTEPNGQRERVPHYVGIGLNKKGEALVPVNLAEAFH